MPLAELGKSFRPRRRRPRWACLLGTGRNWGRETWANFAATWASTHSCTRTHEGTASCQWSHRCRGSRLVAIDPTGEVRQTHGGAWFFWWHGIKCFGAGQKRNLFGRGRGWTLFCLFFCRKERKGPNGILRRGHRFETQSLLCSICAIW